MKKFTFSLILAAAEIILAERNVAEKSYAINGLMGVCANPLLPAFMPPPVPCAAGR
ncbi:MAG TPA: hypothetical protein VKP67_15065 [Xanthobacteraceae bacterium]|nr:hypothetical protein [Xanthobacteraceae bacterium]